MLERPVTARVPRENAGEDFVTLAGWLAEEGQRVKVGQPVAEVETSKALLEVCAPASGCVRRQHQEGSQVPVGEVLFYLTGKPSDPLPAVLSRGETLRARGRFSDKALALMARHRIAARAFPGPGLVREADVMAAVRRRENGPARAAGARFTSRPLPPLKLAEIRRLSGGQNGGLASTVGLLCSTGGLRAVAARRVAWGGSLLPVVVFEAARLLRRHRAFNAFFEADVAHYYTDVNIGIALDAGRGLSVPVVRDAAGKELARIAREIQELSLRYLEGELRPSDLSAATFTVTDLSAEDVFEVRPLIGRRQSATLAIGAEFLLPGEKSGIFQLSLTFDHRLSEGRPAALFLRELRERLKAREREGAR